MTGGPLNLPGFRDLETLNRQLSRVPYVVVTRILDQLVTSGSTQTVTYDQVVEDNTPEAEKKQFDSAVSTSRLTCVVPGVYQPFFQVSFDANGTGFRQLEIDLTRISTGANTLIGLVNGPAFTGADWRQILTPRPVRLEVGDFIFSRVFQNSGVNLNVSKDLEYSPYFGMIWLRA